MHRFSRHRLQSGLVAGVVAAPRFRRAIVQIWFRAGSRFESATTSGASHLLEHVLFRGTARYPTRQALDDALHSIRADHNAFTEQEWLSLFVEVPVEHVGRGIELLAEIAFRPRLAEIDIERRIVEAEIREANLADGLVEQRIGRLLWGPHPLGFPIAGRRSPRSDRRALGALHRRHFRPANATLLVAGAVTPQSVLPAVRRAVRGLPAGDPCIPPPPPAPRGPRVAFGRGTGKEVRILLHARFDGTPPSDDRTRLELLASLLWERLNRTLREERGACYDLDVGVDFSHGFGALGLYVVVRKTAANAAVTEVVRQLADALAGRGDDADLARVHANWIRDLALIEDDIDELAHHYADQLLATPPESARTPDDAIAFVESSDRARIAATAARTIAPDALTMVLLGTWSTEDRATWRRRFARHVDTLRRAIGGTA